MSRLTPDNIVYAAVNEVFGNLDGKDRHSLFLEIRKEYQKPGRFHHTYGRLSQNLEQVNQTEWDNRPAVLAAALFEKAFTPANMLDFYHRGDLIRDVEAILSGDKNNTDAQKFAEIAQRDANDVTAAVNKVAECIYAGDFSGIQVARSFADATDNSMDDIMKNASNKVQSLRNLKQDNSFPFVSGLTAKLA